MEDSALFRLLQSRLPRRDLEALSTALSRDFEADYDKVIQSVRSRLPALSETVERNRARVRQIEPSSRTHAGRVELLLENSPPPMLLELAREYSRKSYDERFDNPGRSLELATIGLRAAQLLRPTSYLSPELQADLEAEALMYFANAQRINSDLVGAGSSLAKAEARLGEGTGDRFLKADLQQRIGHFRFSQGRTDDASKALDHEIRLRRSLKETKALGLALINRAIIGTWREPVGVVCAYLAEGVPLVDDCDFLILPLAPLAERLARDGKGLMAWKITCTAEAALTLAGSRSHRHRIRWVKGLAYRSLGELDSAVRELSRVRDHLVENGPRFRAAIVSLDLAAVYASKGDFTEVKQLAADAYEVFKAEHLETRALAALVMLQEAVLAQRATSDLVLRVADFIARYQHEPRLQFEPPPDS